MTRGELAAAAGCNAETVRYYERIGLLPEPPRSEGGHRVYASAHARRLAFIVRSRALGFRVEDVRELLGLIDGRGTCDDARRIGLDHLAEVRARIADLQRIEGSLRDLVDRCVGGATPSCGLVDALIGGPTGSPL